MAKLIRLDIINGNPRSFVAPAELEQGLFLEIVGKAENVDLGVDPDYEAYEVELADAETERGQLLLHASVANQYDERLSEVDFVLPKGKVINFFLPRMRDYNPAGRYQTQEESDCAAELLKAWLNIEGYEYTMLSCNDVSTGYLVI